MTIVSGIERVKLNATNIKSVLVRSNKRLGNLRKIKLRQIDIGIKQQKRRKLEAKIEKIPGSGIVKSAIGGVVGLGRSVLNKVLDLVQLLFLGFALNNLPKIIAGVKSVIEFVKPIWNAAIKTLHVITNGFMMVGKIFSNILRVWRTDGIINKFKALGGLFKDESKEIDQIDSEVKKLNSKTKEQDVNSKEGEQSDDDSDPKWSQVKAKPRLGTRTSDGWEKDITGNVHFQSDLSSSSLGAKSGDLIASATVNPNKFIPNTSGGKVVEYLTGDRSHSNYRKDHGGNNYHEHLAFSTTKERDNAMKVLKASGFTIGSVNDGKHAKGSYHYNDLAFDVPFYPNAQNLNYSDDRPGEEQFSEDVRSVLKSNGFSGAGITPSIKNLEINKKIDKPIQIASTKPNSSTIVLMPIVKRSKRQRPVIVNQNDLVINTVNNRNTATNDWRSRVV